MRGLRIQEWIARYFRTLASAPRLQPLKQDIVGDIGTALWVVMGTLGLVLLIACANVANLLLVRAEARQQELAIRAALGAGWGRIAREMLVESMTLGVLGGALGLGLAYAALRILVAKGPDTLPRLRRNRHRSARAGVCLRCVFALGRAVRRHPDREIRRTPCSRPRCVVSAERSATAGSAIGRATRWSWCRWRSRSCCLIGSGLMIRTFQHLRSVQPGFTHPEEIQITAFHDPEGRCQGARARDADAARDSGQARRHSRRHVGGVGQRRAAGIISGRPATRSMPRTRRSRKARFPPPANPQDRTGILQDDGHASRCGTRLYLDRPVRETARRHRVGESGARVVGRSACGAGQADSRTRRRRSLARNRGRRRKRLRRRRAREAARVRLLAGPDGPLHLGRRKRIRR